MAISSIQTTTLLLFLFVIAEEIIAQERNFAVTNEKNCNDLSNNFDSLQNALETLRETRFALTQNFNIKRKKGLKSGEYYSCDSQVGYLVILIDESYSIYFNVPKSDWDVLISSNDPEFFIRQEISKKYVRLE